MANVNFTTTRSIEVMDRIFAFIEANDGAFAKQIEDGVELSTARCNVFLNHMRSVKRICSIVKGAKTDTGRKATTWSVNKDYESDMSLQDYDDLPVRVTVRKKWPPNHVRDFLDCFLFGVPAAMQVSA